MSNFGQPPSGGGGFGQPPGGGGFGQPPGGFGQPPGGGFGPPSGGPGGGFGGPAGAAPAKTDVLAIVSTVCGVLGFLSCCCVCLVPFPIAAIVCGGLSLSRIGKDPMLKGKELAYVGLGLGGLTLLLTIAQVIYSMVSGGSLDQPTWDQYNY